MGLCWALSFRRSAWHHFRSVMYPITGIASLWASLWLRISIGAHSAKALGASVSYIGSCRCCCRAVGSGNLTAIFCSTRRVAKSSQTSPDLSLRAR